MLVVCLAARCCAHLALGLKKRFQQYAGACIPAYLEKFKEKKQNVVTALREAIDAAYATVSCFFIFFLEFSCFYLQEYNRKYVAFDLTHSRLYFLDYF